MRAVIALGLIMVAASAGNATDPSRIAPRVARAQIKENVNPSEIGQKKADMRSAIYGLVANEPETAARFPLSGADPTIHVGGLGRNPQGVCVKIARAQGGYHAEFQASVPGGSGPATIRFDSGPAARARLAADRPSAIAMGIRATVAVDGKCPSAVTTPLLPSSWSGKTSENYTILVGGASTGSAAVRVDGGDVQFCPLISEVLRRSDLNAGVFAYSCPVRLPASSCTTPIPVKVLWFRGSRLAGTANVMLKGLCRG